jgi:murein DD-endopeptidase MepM/ murein hydrolase activator NlpD
MKQSYTLLCLLLTSIAFAQIDGPYNEAYISPPSTECLSQADRQQIFKYLETSKTRLMDQGILPEKSTMVIVPHPLFQWPVVKSPDAPYNNVWSISNHVDHNISFPNALQDYNCGTRTYDTAGGYNHQGIDIFTWPFSWYMFQNNYAWVVAAAPGVIIGKFNGNFDMNCAFNNGNWNAVYVQHTDGSVAWYGHLKNGSLTTKMVGQSVETGEFLGVVGSSGNSTGPHLHFEVYNSSNQLIDTYAGLCNTWASATDSWWENQKPYVDPKINAVFTHSGVPAFNTCPTTETTKFKDNFEIGETVYCATYLADQVVGSNLQIVLRRPNNSIAFADAQSATNNYNASYWYWSFGPTTINQNGVWSVSFTFAGNTFSQQFTVGTLGISDFDKTQFHLYPNPAQDKVTFSIPVQSLQVYDLDGKKLDVDYTEDQVNIEFLSNGVYLFKGKTVNGQIFTKKLIK